MGRLAPIVLLVAALWYAMAAPSPCPDCAIKNGNQAVAVAQHEYSKWGAVAEEPGSWQSDINHGRWTVTKHFNGGVTAQFQIDARTGKVIEEQMTMSGGGL